MVLVAGLCEIKNKESIDMECCKWCFGEFQIRDCSKCSCHINKGEQKDVNNSSGGQIHVPSNIPTQPESKGWISGGHRQNLLSLAKKYPNEGMIMNCIDAAYVGGFDDGRTETLAEIERLVEEIPQVTTQLPALIHRTAVLNIIKSIKGE